MEDAYSYVPPHMRDGFKLWIEHGISPGSFGMAVLNNDLKEAVARADHINKIHLTTIVSWLYNFAPIDCWGSYEKTNAWQKKLRQKIEV